MNIADNRLHLYVSEVQKRMDEGVTRPWFCLADNALHYVVKTAGEIPSYQMIYEWIGCKLAREFGLNTPSVKLIHDMSIAIKPMGGNVGFDETSISFGSEYQQNTVPLSFEQSKLIPIKTKHDLFVFDYWIKNGDRTLSELGGNVNLLFSIPSRELVVFDHNNAFDKDFDVNSFLYSHVFAKDNREHAVDMIDEVDYNSRFNECIGSLPGIISQIPEEWIEQADIAFGCAVIDDKIMPILNRYRDNDFWGRIR